MYEEKSLNFEMVVLNRPLAVEKLYNLQARQGVYGAVAVIPGIVSLEVIQNPSFSFTGAVLSTIVFKSAVSYVKNTLQI